MLTPAGTIAVVAEGRTVAYAYPEHANLIVETVNAHDDLVGTLRDIARRAEDETLGIQAARLTAIANQAHAAIRKAEVLA